MPARAVLRIMLILTLAGRRLPAIAAEGPHILDPASDDAWPIEVRRAACKNPDGDEFFFPAGVLFGFKSERLDDFSRRWFSRALGRMVEPSLTCKAPSADTYRLLMLPTWGAPVAVRVTLTSTTAEVAAKRLSGNGGYDPGTLLGDTTSSLSPTDAARFKSAVADSAFWSTPTSDLDNLLRVRDGTAWVIEGRSGDRYHVVFRGSPEAGKFDQLCLVLLRMTGVNSVILPRSLGHQDVRRTGSRR